LAVLPEGCQRNVFLALNRSRDCAWHGQHCKRRQTE
jgi:hypothetical protein